MPTDNVSDKIFQFLIHDLANPTTAAWLDYKFALNEVSSNKSPTFTKSLGMCHIDLTKIPSFSCVGSVLLAILNKFQYRNSFVYQYSQIFVVMGW